MLINCPNLGYGRGTRAAPITVLDNYERSSVETANSTVVGEGDSAIITLVPRIQQSEFHSGGRRWLEVSADIDNVLGLRPTIRVSRMTANVEGGSDWDWSSTRRAMVSQDGGLTWAYAPNISFSGSGLTRYAEFRFASAFTSNKVRIGRSRQVSVHACGTWLDSMAASYPGIFVPAPSAVAYTPTSNVSGFDGQSFIADEFSTQTDELGRTIPIQPVYAAKISNSALTPSGGGSKKLAIVTAGVHAGEDLGDWCMRSFIGQLLSGSSDGNKILGEYDILLYPLINAPGRAGGGYRGGWTVNAGKDDANRNFSSTGVLEIVDKPKGAMTTDRAGVVPDWSIDFHGTGNYTWGGVRDASEPLHTDFYTRQATNAGVTMNDEADTLTGHLAGYMRGLGTKLHLTLEVGDVSPISDAAILSYHTALAKTIRDMFDAGAFA